MFRELKLSKVPSESKIRWAERALEAPDTLTYSQYRAAYWLYTNYSDHWKSFRREALAFYGRKCRKCGAEKHLQVHHRWYTTPKTTTLTQVTILCRSCHEAEHVRKGKKA